MMLSHSTLEKMESSLYCLFFFGHVAPNRLVYFLKWANSLLVKVACEEKPYNVGTVVVICKLYAVLLCFVHVIRVFCNNVLPFWQFGSGEVLPASMQQDVMQVHMVVPDRFLDFWAISKGFFVGKQWKEKIGLQDKVVKLFRFLVWSCSMFNCATL